MDSLLIITTGGTIDKVYFDASSDYEVGESVIARLLAQAHVRQDRSRSSICCAKTVSS